MTTQQTEDVKHFQDVNVAVSDLQPGKSIFLRWTPDTKPSARDIQTYLSNSYEGINWEVTVEGSTIQVTYKE